MPSGPLFPVILIPWKLEGYHKQRQSDKAMPW